MARAALRWEISRLRVSSKHFPSAPYRHAAPLEMTVATSSIGHTFGVRVDGTSSRRFLRFVSLTAFQAEGCGGGIAANFIMPPSAVTSISSVIIILTTVHPFATSWPSSPKGDARTLRDWLSVSYVTQYPVPPIFSFPLEGNASKRQRVYKAERRFDTPSLS